MASKRRMKRPPRRFKKRSRRRFGKRMKRRTNFLMVKRTFRIGTWQWNTVTTSDFWRYETYDLNAVQGVADYINAFEEYKIAAVKFKYIPSYDNVGIQAQVDYASLPSLLTIAVSADPHTGTTVPTGSYGNTTFNNFLAEVPNCRLATRGKMASVYYRPSVLEDTNAVVQTRYTRAGWYRCSTPTITHRGHHVFLYGDNAANMAGLNVAVWATFYIKFRGAR